MLFTFVAPCYPGAAPSSTTTAAPQQYVECGLAPMPAARGNARKDQRAGGGLVQPGFESASQHAPGVGERVASSLPGDHQNATQAPMGGPGQERRDLPGGIPARESVQVQPCVDRNSAATQRDRLTPVQPIEHADPDPFGRRTGLTSLPTGPPGASRPSMRRGDCPRPCQGSGWLPGEERRLRPPGPA